MIGELKTFADLANSKAPAKKSAEEPSGTKWNIYPPYPSERIKPVQAQAIELILSGQTDVAIAQKLKIGRTTLWRWKTEDNIFRRELVHARQRLQQFVNDQFQNILVHATGVLQELITKGSKEDQFRAARTAINMAYSFRQSPEAFNPQPDLPPLQG